MDKKPLAGVSLCTVVLLVLGSLCNVVAYQSVQTTKQNEINGRINQRELFFKTIADVANNKEIQRVFLKFQMRSGIFPTSEIPVVTTNHLRQMYMIGMILSKVFSKLKIHSMIRQYQLFNSEGQEEIRTVIKNNHALNSEITLLSDFGCDCEKKDTMGGVWKFPLLCTLLFILMFVVVYAIMILSAIFSGPLGNIFVEYFFLILSIASVFYNEYFNCPPITPYDQGEV